MQKRYLVLLFALVLLLCACGQTEPVATLAPTEAPPAATEATEPAEKKPEDYTGELVVYSSPGSQEDAGDDLVIGAFRMAYPNIQLRVITGDTATLCQWVADQSGELPGDVLWGDVNTLAAHTDLFAPYVCANDAFIDEAFKDENDLWIGESLLPMVFLYNKTLIAEGDMPTTWEELGREDLKGKIAFADPAGDNETYTQLCAMLFSQPTLEEGWALVEKLYANLDGKLQTSVEDCQRLVVSGEYALGITTEKIVGRYDNPDIGYVYPEKNAAVSDGLALIKDCANAENAKLFIDFLTSWYCQNIGEFARRRPVRSDVIPEELCRLSDLELGDYDYAYAAGSREAILEQWKNLTEK